MNVNFDKFLNPHSIAIVGASRSPEKVGHQILKNLIDGGFKGKLFPINPNAKEIDGLRCYPTLNEIPGPVDLALIATPAPLIPTIVQECIQNHIHQAVIISAGFAEAGIKGKVLQQEIKKLIENQPIQIIGPNCIGCMSTVYQLNASFGPHLPKPGSTMVISQSGALVSGILDWANQQDVGISHAITFGNRMDIGEIEALSYAAQDSHTKTVLIYVESFQNASEFFHICSQITPHKPVILLKGGQTSHGQTASMSHTAALASDYVLVKALAAQTGVIIADTLEEWLSLAQAFAMVPAARGSSLTIVTNAGGPGVTSSDEAEILGIEMPELQLSVKNQLRKISSLMVGHNPLDMLGDATPETLRQVLQVMVTDKTLENLLILITPQSTTMPDMMAQVLAESVVPSKIPAYVTLIGGEKMEKAREILTRAHILNFEFPSQALRIIKLKSTYESTRNTINQFPARETGFISAKLKLDLNTKLTKELTLPHAFELLHAYRLTLPKSAIVTKMEEVSEALEFVNKPAVAKTASMTIAHKAQAGGVILPIMTVQEGRLAFRKLRELDSQILFQQMIKGDMEIILGAKKDSQLGAFITVGLGGSLTNALNDRAYAFVPAQKDYLLKMFKQTKAYTLLRKLNLPAEPVIEAMQRLAACITDIPCISEIEINPAILTKRYLYAADVKIRIGS